VANRQIYFGKIIREDDRRQEIARTTHHLIAITKDLLVKVDYLKTILIEGGRPYLAITQLSKSIEDRYETLLQRDAYRYLPGECINIITRMSGSIFGIGCLADSVKQSISDKPESALITILGKTDIPSSSSLDNLIVDIKALIDQLFILRNSIDVKEGKK
jgi:hypothetical protein